MKPKKTKRANLENRRVIFFQVGAIITLLAILFAFEWKSSVEIEPVVLSGSGVDFIEIDMPSTTQKQEQAVKPLTPFEELIIVDDEKEIIDEPLFPDDEDLADLIDIQGWDEPEEEVDEVFVVAEFMPKFQGKDLKHFRDYVAKNVRFPIDAVEHGISGKVFAAFIVDKDGSVTDVRITRKVHPVIDKAVLEVIKKSPQWEPGMNNGRFVKVQFTIAVAFELR